MSRRRTCSIAILGLCATVVKRSTNAGSVLWYQMAAAIRRMIVIMIAANHISARIASMRQEMSDLRVINARHWAKIRHTGLDKSAHALRHERLLGIKHELSDMMKRCA
jgi:hypothetical protein